MADELGDHAMNRPDLSRIRLVAVALCLTLGLLVTVGCRRSSRSNAPAASGPTPEGAPPPIAPAAPVVEASAIPPSAIPQNPAMAPVIKKAVERYFNELGQAPYTCQDLVQKKYLPSLPLAQNGQPLDLNLFLAHHNTK